MRVVFITGASSGIGRAAVLAFARGGSHVIGTARRVDRLESLQAEINALPAPHGDFLPIALDVRDAAAVNAAMRQAVDRFGRLDMLIANAGLGQRGAVAEAEWEHLDTVIRTNIDGVLHSIRAAVPEMRKSGGGHILIVSSVVYNMISPYAATYAASKAFVSSLSRSLAMELEADNIRVTDLLVGRTESEFNDSRLGQRGYGSKASRLPRMTAEEAAAAIVKAAQGHKRRVTLRWWDRLLVAANVIVPGFVGRRALRQYR
jgi:3-oxoacyl-[acyl-carrier protein] reductase